MIKKTTLLAVTLVGNFIDRAGPESDGSRAGPRRSRRPRRPRGSEGRCPAGDAAEPDAAKMEAPKPAAENDMFKKVAGTWRCDSISTDPDGKDMKVKTTWTWKTSSADSGTRSSTSAPRPARPPPSKATPPWATTAPTRSTCSSGSTTWAAGSTSAARTACPTPATASPWARRGPIEDRLRQGQGQKGRGERQDDERLPRPRRPPGQRDLQEVAPSDGPASVVCRVAGGFAFERGRLRR